MPRPMRQAISYHYSYRSLQYDPAHGGAAHQAARYSSQQHADTNITLP